MRTGLLLLLVWCLILTVAAAGAEIHQAAESGDLATVQSLLDADPEWLNARDEAGYTPLHEAAYAGQLDVLQYLLSLGADHDATSASGSTPLHGAAFYGHADAVEMLIAAGAALDVPNGGGYTPLLSACAGGRTDAAVLLIAGGADVNVALEDGTTALYRALWNNSRTLAEALVSAGANVDALNAEGISPLYFAVAYRDSELAGILLDRGTVWDLRGRYDLTMLHYAAARGHQAVVQKLIQQGVDLDAPCINGRTAYDYAVLWGHDDIAVLLNENGATVDDAIWEQFRGDYLGQERPGRQPLPFAENKLLTPFAPHGAIAWSPDGTELFWCHQAMPIQAVWYTKQMNGVWQRPVIAPFAEPELEYADGHPSFTPDGNRVYFHSHRPPVPGGERKEDADIWYVERQGSGWGEPVNLGPPVNTDSSEFEPTISPEGDLYFVGLDYEDSHGAGDVYVSHVESGRFTRPRNLGPPLNTDTHDFSPTFAPDGSYMIFTSMREIMHDRNLKLLASFKKPDGTWSYPVDLGRGINSQQAWHPHVSYDGEYVFYQQGDNYRWFSADVIKNMQTAVVGPSPMVDLPVSLPVFEKSEQYFEHAATNQIAVGDLDGDGDQDAVFSNMRLNNSRVYLNDGMGRFTATEQLLTPQGHGVDLGDLDGDGDLDIFMTCAGYGENQIEHHRPSKVYLNDGQAQFAENGQNLGDSLPSGNAIWLHDIDTDGDLDAMVLYYQEDNGIFLNDGQGQFVRSERTFPDGSTWGDLDGDGDVDILVREVGKGFRSLLNDGSGQFSEKWNYRDSSVVRGRTCLVDLNGDERLDAVMVFGDHVSALPTAIWLGDGRDGFALADADLPITRWGHPESGDLNGDGHTDLFVSQFGFPSAVWLGDGKGQLFDPGVRLGEGNMNGNCVLADLDGDGDLDAFVAAFGQGRNEIWFNRTGE